MKSLQEHLNDASLLFSQGDQGLQGPPGPFEYVDPPEDLYIKGEQVICTAFLLWFLCVWFQQFFCRHTASVMLFLRALVD